MKNAICHNFDNVEEITTLNRPTLYCSLRHCSLSTTTYAVNGLLCVMITDRAYL